jgi:hypothetical protein
MGAGFEASSQELRASEAHCGATSDISDGTWLNVERPPSRLAQTVPAVPDGIAARELVERACEQMNRRHADGYSSPPHHQRAVPFAVPRRECRQMADQFCW